jgi:tRNA-Thr(GGU) m(6)t(6)A37 methyltransferase TsaA
MTRQEYKIHPIGYVHVSDTGYFLEFEPQYIPALRGLAGFSHAQVLWWCHLLDDPEARSILECDQPYRNAPARMGIFATRSPLRPNPIALTAVQILSIDEDQGRIYIPYIDAEDGTPILDLKPYHPSVDRLRKASVPKWCQHWPEWYEDSASFDWEAEFINAR